MPSLSVLLLAGNQPGYEGALALGPRLVGLRALQVCFLKQNYKYRSAATYSTTLSNIVRCLRWLTVSSQADTAPMYTLTSEMCSTCRYTCTHFIFVPFHLHTADKKNESWWLKISDIEESLALWYASKYSNQAECSKQSTHQSTLGRLFSNKIKCFLDTSILYVHFLMTNMYVKY